MDDIFYMTNKKISVIEINDIAKKVNDKSTFIADHSDALQIEYFHGIIADWVSISVKEFSEPEDKIFLSDNKINSIFCISYHPSQFNFVLPHLKALLQEYGGFIGNDSEGFQPCFSLENIDFFNQNMYL